MRQPPGTGLGGSSTDTPVCRRTPSQAAIALQAWS